MLRLLWVALLALVCTISVQAQGTCPAGTPNAGLADCWFVAASGADTNNGTSESTPFLHHPGALQATSNAAAVTMSAGKAIITRGGDVFHFGNSGLTPFDGYGSTIWSTTSANGTITNCNRNPAAGTLTNTSCIYIGVDQAWFNAANCGASWCQPVIDGDNPISTTPPAGGCTFQDGFDSAVQPSFIFAHFGNYTIFDNFEIRGYCWDGANPTVTNTSVSANAVIQIGTGSEAVNDIWHGWSEGPNATGSLCAANSTCDYDEYWAIQGPNVISTYSRTDNCTFDGTDSTFGNLFGAYGDASGGMIRGGGEIDHDAFVHVSNIIKDTNVSSVHDIYMDAIYEPKPPGTHGNMYEAGVISGGYNQDTYGYNILILRGVIGETYDIYPGNSTAGKHGFFFNLINANPDGGAGVNCFQTEGDQGTPGPFYFFNNTNVSACAARTTRGSTTGTFTNGHYINYSPAALSSFSTLTTTTNGGNNFFPTTTVANSQGYTVGGNWAPTSATCNGIPTNCTVGAGANLSSTMCGIMDNSVAAAACLLGAPTFSYNATTRRLTITPGAARGTTWDAGAYQFSGGASTPTPAPATTMFSTIMVNPLTPGLVIR